MLPKHAPTKERLRCRVSVANTRTNQGALCCRAPHPQLVRRLAFAVNVWNSQYSAAPAGGLRARLAAVRAELERRQQESSRQLHALVQTGRMAQPMAYVKMNEVQAVRLVLPLPRDVCRHE